MFRKIEGEKRVNDWQFGIDSMEHYNYAALHSHGVYFFNHGCVLRNAQR